MRDNGIVNIPAGQVYQHPDNPRKDLGDLSELSESISKKGIMQNLTVIPGHWLTGEEYKKLCREYNENPGEELRMLINKSWTPEGYTLLIGHRRCAAAKLAGVKELPCRVVDGLDKKEQVSMMLEENMQRNDLTILEQANGFQMMLDLGDTEEQIADKTGFSRTTVRHRLEIAKLNQKELKKKEEDVNFQLSLKDLYELEKIPDVKTRDRILKEATSSNNLALKAQTAFCDIKRKEHEKTYEKLCQAEGIKPAPKAINIYGEQWEIIKEFDLDEKVNSEAICSEQSEGLFYTVWWRTFVVVKRKKEDKKKLSEYEMLQKEKDERKRQIKTMQKEMSKERLEFVRLAARKKFKPDNDKLEDVEERLFSLITDCETWVGKSTMVKFFTGETSLYGKTDQEKADYEKQRDSTGFIYKLLIYAASAAEGKDLAEWDAGYHNENGKLVMRFDSILALFGFSYSKEEYYKLAEGTHGLFENEQGNKS